MSSGEGFVGADFPGACKAGTLAHHRRLQYICKFEFKCEECEDRDDLLTLPDVLVRLPTPYLAQFPDGRAHQETTTARFRRQKTDVPLPQVLHHGRDETLGSHLIIRYMEHRRDMYISSSELKDSYRRMVRCLLQPHKRNFSRIRSLLEDDYGSTSAAGRPVTQNMNNMLQLANMPRSVLPKQNKRFDTADEWYVALAEMHVAQLVFQHNDLIASEDDCRNKYVARQLFRRLTKKGKISTYGFTSDKWTDFATNNELRAPALDGEGSFKLWCDDVRPVNVLLDDDDKIAAVID
ncbi:hypothetical protein ACKVV1_008363 [Pyricularia oryzae]